MLQILIVFRLLLLIIGQKGVHADLCIHRDLQLYIWAFQFSGDTVWIKNQTLLVAVF